MTLLSYHLNDKLRAYLEKRDEILLNKCDEVTKT